ncbi:MAG TPA: cupin domain-containing protein [Methanospirillum sp.]|nr:cupin domain-containing protein [Methanospirillum sp.]
MHAWNTGVLLLLAILLTGIVSQASAESANSTSDFGVIISAPSLGVENLSGEISAIDILPLLNSSGKIDVRLPESVTIINIEPGQTFSPSAIRPGAEILYILTGSAEVTADDSAANASEGDAILVSAGSVMMVKNLDTDRLTLFSILSAGSGEKDTNLSLVKRSKDSKPPVTFGNASTSTSFTVHRVYSTFEEALPLSFDLAIATLPAGNLISNHYLESGQLGYVLSGTGNATIDCVTRQISTGDLTYVPPGVVQSFAAKDTLQILLVTEPFYNPEKDHSSESIC